MAFKIRFLLTNRCTATCDYCHNEGQGKHGASQLRVSQIADVLDTLQAGGYVLSSIQQAQQFPALQLRVNHPLRDVPETVAFVQRTRELGVDCKVIEMFGQDTCAVNLRTVHWENLGYTRQACGDWLHTNGKHRVFHKRCGAEHNTADNTLFIGADGVRRSLDGAVIGAADNFNLEMLNP